MEETLKDCLLRLYLEWQRDTGTRGTITAWAKYLDPDGNILSRANLASLMRGDNTQTSMQVAYLIYEKTGDTCVMELLGYPVPDAPLVGLEPDSCSDRQGYASLIGDDGSVVELPRIERGYPACRSVARRAHLSAPCITILLCRP